LLEHDKKESYLLKQQNKGVETFSDKITEQLKRVEIIKNRKYKPADKYSLMQTDYVWLLENLT
jgi:BRCT domain type II-containing protein